MARLLVLLGTAALLVQCKASFRSGAMSGLSASDLDAAPKLRVIRYDVQASGKTKNVDFVDVSDPGPHIEPLLRRAFAGVERGAPPAEPQPGAAPYLDIQVQLHSGGVNGAGILLALLTLGIWPVEEQTDIRMEAKLLIDGAVAKSCRYDEHVNNLQGTLLIPWAFSRAPADVWRDIIADMTLRLIADLRKDVPALSG